MLAAVSDIHSIGNGYVLQVGVEYPAVLFAFKHELAVLVCGQLRCGDIKPTLTVKRFCGRKAARRQKS